MRHEIADRGIVLDQNHALSVEGLHDSTSWRVGRTNDRRLWEAASGRAGRAPVVAQEPWDPCDSVRQRSASADAAPTRANAE